MYYNPEGNKKSISETILFEIAEFRGREEGPAEEILNTLVRSPCNEFLCYRGISMVKQYKVVCFFQHNGKTLLNSKSKFFMRRHVLTVKVVKQQE